jgi:hypothetical protein
MKSNFINSQFDRVKIPGSYFSECEFIRPKFNKVQFLSSVTLHQSKIWNLNKCIEVNSSDDVSEIISDLEANNRIYDHLISSSFKVLR